MNQPALNTFQSSRPAFNFSLGNNGTGNKLTDKTFEEWRKLIYDQCGIYFQDNKKYLLESRLQKRILYLKIDTFEKYLEYVKYRTYANIDKKEAQYCLRYVIENSVKLLAPISPHIADEIYYEMFEKKSLQQVEWPKEGEINENAIQEVEKLKEVISQARQFKSSNKLSQAAEISEATVVDLDDELIEELRNISKIKEVKKGKELGFKV